MQNNSITEIQQQLEKYFDALYFCDVKLLRDVFHPEAIYINATDQPVLGLSMSEYFPIVASRISPASKQQLRQDKIISINLIHKDLAMVHVECAIEPKYFYDALTLVQKQGEWKIISKVFHYQTLAD
ncbi:MAG: nuclear transport factor 2 family protein [Moraxellaceae bacterium]|nr:nuclear transport factor 2 family protein [Moraxellaceae bacterium]MBH2029429.1 nuclear transport factor 2 family protein [Moraxellaceae bacterium]